MYLNIMNFILLFLNECFPLTESLLKGIFILKVLNSLIKMKLEEILTKPGHFEII